jgi:hypothetical protein
VTATTTARRALPVGRAVLVTLLAATLVACDGAAPKAKSTLQQMASMQIATTAPPESISVGRGEDVGSDSTVTRRDPALSVAYASKLSPAAILAYYKANFAGYHLVDNAYPATPGSGELTGASGWANVSVIAQPGPPTMHPYSNLKLGSYSGSDYPTGVLVYIVGQPPRP